MPRPPRSPVEVNYSHEMTRKVFRLPKQLLMEFRELIVFPTGLSESEVIRGLMVERIREQKRFKAANNTNNGGDNGAYRKSSHR